MNLDKIKPYAKTVVAVVGVVVTAVAQEFPDDPNVAHWCSIASTIMTAVLVYVVPNRDPLGEKQDESVQPPDAGQEFDSQGALVSDDTRCRAVSPRAGRCNLERGHDGQHSDARGYWGGI